MAEPALLLFHRVADGACAHVRRRVVELGLVARVGFRNVHFEVHQGALAALGGGEVPAVWDGARLHVGEAACVAALGAAVAGG